MSGGDGQGHNSGAQSTGGVNGTAGPGGASSGGGVDASDHSGWSSENNPWGGGSGSGVHWGGGSGNGNNGGQTGGSSSGVNLSLFPEAQARASPPGQGMVKVLAEASLLRDQHSNYHGCFKLVCRAIISLLDNAPHGLSSGLQGLSHEDGMSTLKRLLWRFSRSADVGLPSSALTAKTEWHTKLLTNVKALLAEIEKQYGYKIAGTLDTKLTKKLLPDLSLASAAVTQAHGLRVNVTFKNNGFGIIK